MRLILAIEYHRFYEEAFTASLYLGRSFTFGLFPDGYPEAQGWRRIGELVPPLGARDYWWYNFDPESARDCLANIPEFERNFLGQPQLIARVQAVDELTRRSVLNARISALVDENGGSDRSPRAAGLRMPSMVPRIWFWAAEEVLSRDGSAAERAHLAAWTIRYGVDGWQSAQAPI